MYGTLALGKIPNSLQLFHQNDKDTGLYLGLQRHVLFFSFKKLTYWDDVFWYQLKKLKWAMWLHSIRINECFHTGERLYMCVFLYIRNVWYTGFGEDT